MIYCDGSRLGSDTLHDLFRYCDKKGINVRDIQADVIVFVHITKSQIRLIGTSKSVKWVDADTFNKSCLRASNAEIKAYLKAWSEISEAKKVPLQDMQPVDITRKFGKTYRKVGSYTPTGEFDLFLEIAQERRGADGVLRSEISGAPLIDNPKHPFYVNQFMHCVPKGQYERYRLLKENIFLGTVSEHRLQTNDPGATKKDPRWNEFWATFERLRERYHRELTT